MKHPILISILAALALSVLTPSMSLAVSSPQSDESLRVARARVERDIDMLQRDQHDYDGHRQKAVDDLQAARQQLLVALEYDKSHDYWMPLAVPVNPEDGLNRSDWNLVYVRGDVGQAIDALQRDNTDYGGHRVDAIALLQRSREQLEAALQSDRNH